MEADLADELASLDAEFRARLEAHGFSRDRLLGLAATLREGSPETRRDQRNRVSGEVRAPAPEELPQVDPSDTTRLAKLGHDALAAGKVALCVMAGGMATRMGGVVKALVEAFDGKTFLDVRLAENAAVSKRVGRPVPLWLMTSDATDEGIRKALGNAPSHIETFVQDLSVRLTPSGRLFRDADGKPSTYATGHGDLPDALVRSGILDRFLAAGGETVWITNLDNLGATLDEAMLGFFLESKKEVMVEVCPKAEGDRGGIPVHALCKMQVLEEFRLPKGFDPATVRVFNTNTFLVRAAALKETRIPWTFFEVEKKVDGRPAVQFERLLQELTSALPSGYVRVPREGTESRFEPVKDNAELERRRPRMRAIAKARGFA
jgi:UTP--glucose-1-phosphate uridylyltransferase